MADFTIGNASLGTSTGYTASGSCYQDAKAEVQQMLRDGQRPDVDSSVLRNIEYVAGEFSFEERRQLGLS